MFEVLTLSVVTLSLQGSSALIISGSLLAMLTGGQTSPWCEVVSLLKFAFITSSVGSIGNTTAPTNTGMPVIKHSS